MLTPREIERLRQEAKCAYYQKRVDRITWRRDNGPRRTFYSRQLHPSNCWIRNGKFIGPDGRPVSNYATLPEHTEVGAKA
jgi:hypothetical protein